MLAHLTEHTKICIFPHLPVFHQQNQEATNNSSVTTHQHTSPSTLGGCREPGIHVGQGLHAGSHTISGTKPRGCICDF